MRRRAALRPVVPRTLPRAAVQAARELVARTASVGRAERALALALRRYIPRSDKWSDRALIEAVAQTRIRTAR